MSRKLLRIAVVYGLVLLTTALSCCRVPPVRLEQATRWQLVPVANREINLASDSYTQSETFHLVIFFGYTQGMAARPWSPIPSAQALSCPDPEIINELSEQVLTLDTAFQLNGRWLPANTNIIALLEKNEGGRYSLSSTSPLDVDPHLRLTFEAAQNSIRFPVGNRKFQFYCRTSHGVFSSLEIPFTIR